jgi:hypothetical protein
MTDKRMLMCFVTALAVMSTALSAHHSHAVYEDSPIALKNATVIGLIWANPHAILTFAVKDARGKAANWSAESGSPTSLSRIGWNRNSAKAGDAVTIELYPARNGARVGRLAKVIFPDGRVLLDSQNRNAVTQ